MTRNCERNKLFKIKAKQIKMLYHLFMQFTVQSSSVNVKLKLDVIWLCLFLVMLILVIIVELHDISDSGFLFVVLFNESVVFLFIFLNYAIIIDVIHIFFRRLSGITITTMHILTACIIQIFVRFLGLSS